MTNKKSVSLVSVLLLTGMLVFTGCNMALESAGQTQRTTVEENESLSWDDYQEIMVESFGDKYLVEGDIVFSTMEQVKDFYDAMACEDTAASKSTGHLINNRFDVWSDTEKGNITYKVSGFSNNTDVRNDLNRAISSWEAAAPINFIDRTGSSGSVVFIVRPATAAENRDHPGTNASAFFPHEYARELVLFSRFFGYTDAVQQRILKHELGHILGLRHEQKWFYGSLESRVKLLTDRDSASVMYSSYAISDSKYKYTGNGDLSAKDKLGAKILYNPNYGFRNLWGTGDAGANADGISYLPVDINGDGKMEILKTWKKDGRMAMTSFVPSGDRYSKYWSNGNLGQGAETMPLLTGDINGDGKTDIIQPWSNNGRMAFLVYTSSNGTWYRATWGGTMSEGAPTLGLIAGDVNGDGKTDIIQPWNNNGRMAFIVYKSNGTGLYRAWGGTMSEGAPTLGLIGGDINGDGKTDIIQPWSNSGKMAFIVYKSNGTALTRSWGGTMNQGSGTLGLLAGDINGDGKTDLIQPWDNGGKLQLITYKSNGTGLVQGWAGNTYDSSSTLGLATGDVNGDGKTDIIQPWSNNGTLALVVYTSDGYKYEHAWTKTSMNQGHGAIKYLYTDYNGDNKTDIVQLWNNSGKLGIITYKAQF